LIVLVITPINTLQEMVKKCSKCEIEKIYSEFYKDKRAKDGLMSWCKCCVKKYRQDNRERVIEYGKQHYQENKEHLIERKKQYYQENKEYYKQYRQDNRERINGHSKQYRQENKERVIERNKQRYQENKEYYKEYHKQYNQDNRERINECRKQYRKKRIKTDTLLKMKESLRSRTYQAFKYKGYSKNTKTQQMLGVSWEVCKAHIGNQFTKGMNWDNYGEWHIDHVIPLASANTEKELTKLCHYSNLQPLWAEDNLSKGSKIESQQMKLTI
jgi:hypothetical protein